jgi:hypothetical protein
VVKASALDRFGCALLVAAVTLSACFDTEQIPEGAGSGGSSGAANSGGKSGISGAAGVGNEAGENAGGSSSGGSASVTGGTASGGVSAGKGGSSGGGTPPIGGSAGRGGNASTGGRATTGGAASSGGSASGGSAGQASKVDWLSFVNSDAPAALSPNGALGIDGALSSRRDSCAVLDWNETTRCASGMLCNANNGENWGVALVFDFKHTGPDGTPPNTTEVWNPNGVDARGVAWEVTGTAPGLQVWVLNMAPEWNGQCSAETCEIDGPPDGTSAAAASGQLLFNNMKKDDWGGSGLVYKYDPAKVHALQFKLPAIVVGPVSFSFCLKSLGIVR